MNPLFFLYTFLFSIGCAASSLRGSSAVYDTNQSNICVWLSGAAYCDKDNYESMKLAGPASGFELTNVLYDKHTDLQGYVGYLAKTNSIYVIFRGTSSMTNWLDDAEIIQTSYTTFPECDCKVHSGFYKSAVAVSHAVRDRPNAKRDRSPVLSGKQLRLPDLHADIIRPVHTVARFDVISLIKFRHIRQHAQHAIHAR